MRPGIRNRLQGPCACARRGSCRRRKTCPPLPRTPLECPSACPAWTRPLPPWPRRAPPPRCYPARAAPPAAPRPSPLPLTLCAAWGSARSWAVAGVGRPAGPLTAGPTGQSSSPSTCPSLRGPWAAHTPRPPARTSSSRPAPCCPPTRSPASAHSCPGRACSPAHTACSLAAPPPWAPPTAPSLPPSPLQSPRLLQPTQPPQPQPQPPSSSPTRPHSAGCASSWSQTAPVPGPAENPAPPALAHPAPAPRSAPPPPLATPPALRPLQ